MTVNVSRGLERFERRLQERSEKFQQELDKLAIPEEAFGLRLTALPVGEGLPLGHAGQLEKLFPPSNNPVKDGLWLSVKKKSKVDDLNSRLLKELHSDFSSLLRFRWQPRLHDALGLREIRREMSTLSSGNPLGGNLTFSYHELHRDGLLEFGHMSCSHLYVDSKAGEILFNPDWPLVLLANAASWVDRIRRLASAPGAKYNIQIEIQCRGKTVIWVGGNLPPLRSPPMLAPISNYSLDQKPADLLLTFYQHFWGLLGRDGEGYGKEGNGERYDEIEFEVGEKQDK